MEETLNALSGLLLKALPTFILVVLLHFYMKRMFFKPMDKVLREREDAVQGVRKLAEDSRNRAEQLAAEFEAGLRAARTEIYHEQENARKKLAGERAAAVQESRTRTQELVKEARAQLAGEVAGAKGTLAAEADRLADQIAAAVLGGRKG